MPKTNFGKTQKMREQEEFNELNVQMVNKLKIHRAVEDVTYANLALEMDMPAQSLYLIKRDGFGSVSFQRVFTILSRLGYKLELVKK